MFFILTFISIFIVSCHQNFNGEVIISKDQTEFYKSLNQNVNFYCETGYVKINDLTQSENWIYYHLFLKEGIMNLNQVKQDDIFLLWIPGGPGSAGLKYAFKYTGPFKVKQGKLELWDYKINEHAHVLYLDMPFGAGFSYSTKPNAVNSTEEAAGYVIELLQIFLTHHQVFQGINFHVVGISYAGHFVPRIALKIIESNLNINYKGVFIGGAWTEALSQFKNQASTLISYGLIDQYRYDYIHSIEAILQNLMMEEKYYEAATSTIDITFELEFLEYFDPDNIYKQTNEPNDNSYITFLVQNKKQYGIPDNINFNPSNFTIYSAFRSDSYMSFLNDIEILLTKGKVMLYNGQFDYNICSAGVQIMINNMKSDIISEWKKQKKRSFYYYNKQTNNFEIAGTIKQYNNFSFSIVYQAGHLTQLDQAGSAYELLKIYLDQ